ncbi:hypothetical protein HOY82DRAFT_595805 [Tuber indicum]|nr:hypothetical protein HOY82DRAFT_595805 [Tuber indicum]
MYHNSSFERAPEYALTDDAPPISDAWLAFIRNKIMVALKEVADVLCPHHVHRVSPELLPPGFNSPWYNLTIPCGKNDIAWKLEIYRDCKLKSVTRCKRVDVTVTPPVGPSWVAKFCQPRLVWGEYCCNEILGWVKEDVALKRWWWLDEQLLQDTLPDNVLPTSWDELEMSEEDMDRLETMITPPYTPGSATPCSMGSPEKDHVSSTIESDDITCSSDTHSQSNMSDDYSLPPPIGTDNGDLLSLTGDDIGDLLPGTDDDNGYLASASNNAEESSSPRAYATSDSSNNGSFGSEYEMHEYDGDDMEIDEAEEHLADVEFNNFSFQGFDW